jgi:hypothetical protein
MRGFCRRRSIRVQFLILVHQFVQFDTVGEDEKVGIAAGVVEGLELLPSGGDFLFQGFDCFGVSVRHGFYNQLRVIN